MKARMKTLGIIGGIAPESTVEYYRRIIASWRRSRGDGSYPNIILNSIDMTTMLRLVRDDRAELIAYLAAEVQKLIDAGADVALFASNTPHLVYGEVAARSPIPLISIVEAAADRAAALGLSRVGLFGTAFTMQADFYPAAFAARNIAVIAPPREDLQYVHDKYMGELVNAVFLDETRAAIIDIAQRLKTSASLDGIVLGGTELPLLLRDPAILGVPVLDTTAIHVERAVAAMLTA
jgi:aspartate racemase